MYGEIGRGTRVALLKLAVQKKEECNRSLRIAIDVSIWAFQIQSGKGGTNADLRTLFYRLIRLLRLSIQPLFVFDGPHKPPFKRNKRTNVGGGSAFNCVATELFDLFGFPWINAPGEAEAECALLQKQGIVDAVLSEDVDTLMFGCTMHLRNWSSEGTKSKTSPTHVDVYDAAAIKEGKTGLDREGMVLVALMSGGDYIPAGIPNCGVKIACEAARAGFGVDLFGIDRKDNARLQEWRDRLESELQDNTSGFFRTRHKTLKIPEKFPDRAVLYYYIHPVVSNAEQVEKYRQEIQWRSPNIPALRNFTIKAFEWQGITGLRHFIHVSAPAMLSQTLTQGSSSWNSYDDMDTQAEEEAKVVKTICGKRGHASTDNTPELRIAYIPKDVVGLDLEAERQAQQEMPTTHTAIYSGDEEEIEEMMNDEDADGKPLRGARKKREPYDPSKIEKEWVPESFVKLGAPLTVENWEAEMRDPKKFASRKARAHTKLNRAGMPKGAIEPYLRVEKPGLKDRSLRSVEVDDFDHTPFKRPVITAPLSLSNRSLTDQVDACSRETVSKNSHSKPQPPGLSIVQTSSSVTNPQKRGRRTKKDKPQEMLPTTKSTTNLPGRILEGPLTILSSPMVEKHGRSPSPPPRARKKTSCPAKPIPRLSIQQGLGPSTQLSKQQTREAITILSDEVVNSRSVGASSHQALPDHSQSRQSPQFRMPPVVRAPLTRRRSPSPLAAETETAPAPTARIKPSLRGSIGGLATSAPPRAGMASSSDQSAIGSIGSASRARMATSANVTTVEPITSAPEAGTTLSTHYSAVAELIPMVRPARIRPPSPRASVKVANQAPAARTVPLSGVTSVGVSAKSGRQKVVIRESLEGAWKFIDDDDYIGYITPARQFSGVQVVDLTRT